MRNPRRTSATASALVVGLALVGLVAIFGESVKASVERAVDRGIRADFVLKAQQFAGFLPEGRGASPGAPGAGRGLGVPVRERAGRAPGGDRGGRRPAPAAASRRPRRRRPGRISDLGADGMLVFRDAAERYGLRVGERRSIQFPRGFLVLRVAGIYDQEDFTGGLPVPTSSCAKPLLRSPASGATSRTRSSTSRPATATEVAARPRHRARPRRRLPEHRRARPVPGTATEQEQTIDQFLDRVSVALLLLSEIIAVLGIVNTLALSVYERTRELGPAARRRDDPPPDPADGARRVGAHRVDRRARGHRRRPALGVGVHGRRSRPGDHRHAACRSASS